MSNDTPAAAPTASAKPAKPKKPKTAAPKKAAAKKPRPPAKPKKYLYQTVNAGGTASPISEPYDDMKTMLADIGLSAHATDTVIIYREVKRGALKTKVSIGK